MVLYLYDFEGTLICCSDKIISSYREINWNEIQTAEFHLEADDPIATAVIEKSYLFLEDDEGNQDIITGYEIKDDLTLYCRSLDWLLSKMLLPPSSVSGSLSDCTSSLLSASKGCEIYPGTVPADFDSLSLNTSEVTYLSDSLKEFLSPCRLGRRVRFSHADNRFYLDILCGNVLDFYVSESDGTLSSVSFNGNILDYSNSLCFQKHMKHMGSWKPDTNSPKLYENDPENFGKYYEASLSKDIHTLFGIAWEDGDFIYCNTKDGEWKKSKNPPDSFFVYLPDGDAEKKYQWYEISSLSSCDEADAYLKNRTENRDFSAAAESLSYGKDYKIGDFVRLQYTKFGKTVTVSAQFTSVTVNRDNMQDIEIPTLKEVK